MNEREPNLGSHEKFELNSKEVKEIERRAAEKREQEAARAEAERDSIEAIRERLEKATQNQEKPKLNQQEKAASETAHYSSTGLKSHALNQSLKRVRKQLPARDRAFSKVIHQPAVEAVSNVAESTVARPSGLLFAGLFSLLSSLAVLYICRHYGYEYNFLVGLAALGGGFIVGLVLEVFYKFFKKLFIRSET